MSDNKRDSVDLNRIDHARMALELYRNCDRESEICDLIADLMHLADTIGPEDSDGPAVWAEAHSQYAAEVPPAPSAGIQAEWPILAQVNGKTIAGASSARDASEYLVDPMQRAGFRYSELEAHRQDLHDGHVLTAEDGTTFQLIPAGEQS